MEQNMTDLPERFLEAKKQGGPAEEFKITPAGTKRYIKQIESLEWVPASELGPESNKVVADLLQNLLQVNGFREFLDGTTDLAKTLPEASSQNVSPDSKGAGKKGKGKGKTQWGKGGKNGKYGGKGMGKYGPKGMAIAPMMHPMVDQGYNNSPEMQRQAFGEQLYLMVQPLAPNLYLAQKITGMLLELPLNELKLNLVSSDELSRRVEEALQVLREDGVVQ